MRVELSTVILQLLEQALQQKGWQDHITHAHDAFLLYGGMGPAMYLTRDGRFLIDPSDWEESAIRECTDDEATVALVVGAKRTGVSALLDLLPSAPENSVRCKECVGTRWMTFRGAKGEEIKLVCVQCSGRGWQYILAHQS